MSDVIDLTGKLVRDYKDLELFKLSYAVSLEVHKISLLFPKYEQYALADQLRRSSKSICANLVEGFSKQAHSKPEFKRFLSMAIGSSNETALWLLYAKDLNYIAPAQWQEYEESYSRISRMLQKLRANIKE